MIKLDEKYYITSDDRNFILCSLSEYKNKKTNKKETKQVNEGYYGTLDKAIEGYVRFKTLELVPSVGSIRELLTEIRKLKEYIKNTIGDGANG